MSLFRRDRGGQAVEGDIAAHLLAQDLIYVGGGNVVSLLGAWRAHGLDAVLRRAWRRGRRPVRPVGRLAVLVRRGADRVPRRAAARRGLGLLPYSNCVHYDGEPERRDEYRRFVGDGMRAGLRGRRRRRAALPRARSCSAVVTSRPRARAYRVEPIGDEVVETPLEVALPRREPRWPQPAAA